MIPCSDDGKPSGDIRMTAIMQELLDKTVSEKFNSVVSDIRLQQVIDEIVS